jgi:hypothetical protein
MKCATSCRNYVVVRLGGDPRQNGSRYSVRFEKKLSLGERVPEVIAGK